VYYDLFRKYRSDYQVDKILAGMTSDQIEQRAKKAKFDERLSLLSLFIDALSNDFKVIAITEDMMTVLMNDLRSMKTKFASLSTETAASQLAGRSTQMDKEILVRCKANSMSEETAYAHRRAANILRKMSTAVLTEDATDGIQAFSIVKRIFDDENTKLKKNVAVLHDRLENMFTFCEKVFPDGNEILILITELTHLSVAARFISRYGCDAYFRHNKNLLFYERKKEILQRIEELNLED